MATSHCVVVFVVCSLNSVCRLLRRTDRRTHAACHLADVTHVVTSLETSRNDAEKLHDKAKFHETSFTRVTSP